MKQMVLPENVRRIWFWVSWIFNLFCKVLIIIIAAYPFVWMMLTSFKVLKETNTYPPTFLPTVWVVEGYIAAFQRIDIPGFFKNSVIVSFSVLTLQYLIIIPTAYSFARCKFPLKNLLFGIVLLGFMIPQQLTFIPIYLMFSRMGILQSYLPQILPFIANAFGIFLLRQYFMQIPEEIIESARLDSAGEVKIIFKIMIPMAKTAIFTIGLLSFISNWNSYFWPLIMTTRDTYRTLPIGVAFLTSQEGGRTWNMMMAGNMFLVVPILIVYFFANRQIRAAFSYSGIK